MTDHHIQEEWAPLSEREAGTTLRWRDRVTNGMPEVVWRHVEEWCNTVAQRHFDVIEWQAEVELDLRREVTLDMPEPPLISGGGNKGRRILDQRIANGEVPSPDEVERDRLDAVDCMLGWLDPHDDDHLEAAGRLKHILERAGHLCQPWPAHDEHRLVRRFGEAEAKAIDKAAEVAERQVADYLHRAVVHTYGRNPAPNAAVQEAVRAVERALRLRVAPKDPRPSLGKCIPMLRDQAARWRLLHTPLTVTQLADQLDAFWKSHKSRHDQIDDDRIDHTIEEAELACAQAALLVRLVERHLATAPTA